MNILALRVFLAHHLLLQRLRNDRAGLCHGIQNPRERAFPRELAIETLVDV